MMATPRFDFQTPFSIDDDFNDDPFDFNLAGDYDSVSASFTDPCLEAAHSFDAHESTKYSDEPLPHMMDSIEAAPKPSPEDIQIKGNMTQQREGFHVITPPTSLSPDDMCSISNAKKRKATSDVSKGAIEAHDPSAEKKAKNRVAAAKCREKKKGVQKEMVEIQKAQEREHERLIKIREDLREQVVGLKNSLLMHAECGDHAINQWHKRETERITRGQSAVRPIAQTPRLDPVNPSRHRYKGRSRAVSAEALAQSAGSQPAEPKFDLESPLGLTDSQGSPGSAIHYYPEQQNPLRDGAMMSRTASQHSNIDVLADVAVGRAYSVSFQHQHSPGGNDQSPHQDPPHHHHQYARSSVIAFPVDVDVRNSIEAAPYESSMPIDMTYDPDLHHSAEFIHFSPSLGAGAEEIVVDQTGVED